MKKLVTLTRNGKTVKILLHRDIPAIVGKKLQLDSGPMWLVLEVSEWYIKNTTNARRQVFSRSALHIEPRATQ